MIPSTGVRIGVCSTDQSRPWPPGIINNLHKVLAVILSEVIRTPFL